MLKKNIIKLRGFRPLDAAELEYVSGGGDEKKPDDNVIEVTGRRLPDLGASISSSDIFINLNDFNRYTLPSSGAARYGPPAEPAGNVEPEDPDEHRTPDLGTPPQAPPSDFDEFIDRISASDDTVTYRFNNGVQLSFEHNNNRNNLTMIHPY